MRKTSVPAESSETACPACGAKIKAPTSAKRRRVQCPKCREVVVLEGAPGKQPELVEVVSPPPKPAPPVVVVEERSRVELLEARVEALEAALRDIMTVGRGAGAGAIARKLVWLTSEPGHEPEFSPEQGSALFHNLGGVRSQAITIRTPAGDPSARTHAEWFKSIFERAGWTVRGPEEIEPDAAMAGLSLAVPELPVAKEAAETYLALKAAGFEAIPVLDEALSNERGHDAVAMALTLPRERAA